MSQFRRASNRPLVRSCSDSNRSHHLCQVPVSTSSTRKKSGNSSPTSLFQLPGSEGIQAPAMSQMNTSPSLNQSVIGQCQLQDDLVTNIDQAPPKRPSQITRTRGRCHLTQHINQKRSNEELQEQRGEDERDLKKEKEFKSPNLRRENAKLDRASSNPLRLRAVTTKITEDVDKRYHLCTEFGSIGTYHRGELMPFTSIIVPNTDVNVSPSLPTKDRQEEMQLQREMRHETMPLLRHRRRVHQPLPSESFV